MSPNVTLLVIIGVLYASGVYLLLERSLTRVLLGILVLGNATNVLLLSSGGPAGGAPIVFATDPEDMSDPLPQAMILTAIVITLGMAAFLLSMIYRSWVLDRQDSVVDDDEDREVAGRLARLNEQLDSGRVEGDDDHDVDVGDEELAALEEQPDRTRSGGGAS